MRPNATLAAQAGATLGVRGAIQVTRRLETGLPDVWAAGDCAETYHALLGRAGYLPLGTTPHKQGRIAGENALGGDRVFAWVVGTQAAKRIDTIAAMLHQAATVDQLVEADLSYTPPFGSPWDPLQQAAHAWAAAAGNHRKG